MIVKNYGINVLPPDVNESLWLFNVVDGNLRFGMGAVKNVGQAAVEEWFAKERKMALLQASSILLKE